MKKKIITLALTTLVSLSAFTFVGCGDDKKTEGKKPSQEQTQKDESKKEEPKKEEPKKEEPKNEEASEGMTVEKWIGNPLVQIKLKEQSKGKYEISAKGNTLIYSFPMEGAILTVDLVKEYLESQSPTFQTIGKQLKSELKIKDLEIILRYVNDDGSEFYAHKIIVE